MALFGHTKRAFLDSFMTLKQGIPSHDACSDLFNALDPLKLQTVLMRLVEGFAAQPGDVIATEGKTPRCSCDRARKQSAPHLVQAFATKGNQGALREDVSLFLDAPVHAGICDEFQGVDGAHGRIETRRALLCHDLAWLAARHDWPGLKAIGKVMATREQEGKSHHTEPLFSAEHVPLGRAFPCRDPRSLGH